MDDTYAATNELREKFHALIKSSASEETFVKFMNKCFENSSRLDIKSIQAVLDLTLVAVNPAGCLNPNCCDTQHENHTGGLEFLAPDQTSYDADDEGLDETFIFPCHVTFDDCHPEVLPDYHRGLKSARSSSQVFRHPKLCELLVEFVFQSLRASLIRTAELDLHQSNPQESAAYLGRRSFSNSFVDLLESTVVLVKRLNRICLNERINCRILSRTNLLTTLLSNITFLLQEKPEKQSLFLEPLLRFSFTLADYKITGHNLKQLFSIIKNDNAESKVLLTNLERVLNHHYRIFKNIQPLKSINFPTASKTAEELESDSYISNSWHWRLRSKVIEFKRKRSRCIENSKLSLKKVESELLSGVEENNQAVKLPMTHRITPSWLECSLIAPISNISPLIRGGEIKFCCSMWISICGDLLVIEGSKSKKVTEDLAGLKLDWRAANGYWLRLTSRRRLSRRFKEKSNTKHSSLRRSSLKTKRRLTHDMEDDEQDEIMARKRKSELELTTNRSANGFRFSHSGVNQIRSNVVKSSSANELKTDQKPPKEFLGRRARDNSQELLIHLISFALDTLTIEIWLNIKCMTFCARACRVAREGQTNLLDQVTFPSHLEANGSWFHMAFNFEEMNKVQNSEKVMNLKLVVNGIHKEKEKLVYGCPKSPLANFACLVGCERSTFGYVWKLSQINIYKNLPTKDIIVYLLGKGPDASNFTNFRQPATLTLPDLVQRSVKNLLNPELLDLYSSVDEERTLDWITQNIVLAYTSHQPNCFLDYSSSMIASSLMNPLPVDHEYSNSAERFIQARILNFSRALKFNNNQGFGTALVEAGGVESILICFADLIRKAHEAPEIHALAFSILLKMSQTNKYHLSKFLDELNGLKLVEFTLVHPSCLISKPMLDHYLDFCLVRRGEYSLLKSPRLVYHLMSCWRAWHKDIKVARLLYRKLIKLLQPADSARRLPPEERELESHFINHNYKMIADAGGLELLLSILRESLVPLDEFAPKINHDLVELIVKLISLLIKHPPSLDVMLDIMEFLLFLHPDPKAYAEAMSDRSSFLHVIQSKNHKFDVHNDQTSRLRTPPSESSYQSSIEDLRFDSTSIIDNIGSCSGASFCPSERKISEECSENLAKFINQYNVPPTKNKDFRWSDEIMPNILDQRTQGTNPDEFPEKCSTRNYAIATVSDMLASIVKVSLTDSMKILSEALQRSVIDARKLIVLANNNSFLVREKVLRLFFYCIRACYSLNLRPVLNKYEYDYKNSSFKLCMPIKLMARQLLNYPTTIKMIQLCYGLIVGIDNFETLESVCSIFDIETINNNLQLNTLILLMHLMTQLQVPKEIQSVLKFIHAYIEKLMQLEENDILSVLIKGNLIDCMMKLYFRQVEHEASSVANYESQANQSVDGNSNKEYGDILNELDKTLILVVKYYMQNQSTSETIISIEELLTYFDLMNTYVPSHYKHIFRDRKVKVLTMAIKYCEHYERSARLKKYGGRMEYYLRSLLKSNDLNTFSNTLPESNLISDGMQEEMDLDKYLDSCSSSNSGSYSSNLNGQKGREKINVNSLITEENLLDIDDSYSKNASSSSSDAKHITETRVLERFRSTIELMVNMIATREVDVIPSPLERKFIMKCIKFLSRYLNEYELLATTRSKETKQRSYWCLMLRKLEPTIRSNFSRLILYLLSPCDSMNLDERKYYAFALLQIFSVDQLLNLLEIDSSKTNYRVLGAFVGDLIDYTGSQINSEGSNSDQDDDLLNDDTETKLRLLALSIEEEIGLSNNREVNGYSGKKKAKISDSVKQIGGKYRNVWLADLAQLREDSHLRLASLRPDIQRVNDGSNEDFNRVLDEAMDITRDVVNNKHEQRKSYLEDLKQNKVYNYHIRQQWLSLIIGQTHERAIWCMESHYPKSWELNPVEGPSRIRRRLRPCKLMLEPRYLRNRTQTQEKSNRIMDYEAKRSSITSSATSEDRPDNPTDKEVVTDDWYNIYSPHPLCSLVINHEQSMDSNELRIRMFTTDKIHFNCDCSIIRPNEVCEGEVSIASWCIHFIGERRDSYQQHLNTCKTVDPFQKEYNPTINKDLNGFDTGGRSNNQISSCRDLNRRQSSFVSTIVEDLWFDELVEVWDRRYQLQDVGLEIFLTNNMTYLISFKNNRDREDFKQALMREQHKMINLHRFNLNTSLNKLTQHWRDGKLTNFDFLTCLNKLAGRSFNDLMQYPIFPFVLSNYETKTLDLNSPSNYRKLNKPMAVQNPEKESTFVNNYSDSLATNLSTGFLGVTRPYHYGNHYSNSATVLHFLVRLPPFTQMLIQYQDNNFDQPDRTFHSMANTWQLITRDSNTDFKELIPEFFFLPEMFLNLEQFELGRKQNNELVDDVKLPPWCPQSNPRLFTLIHRQALESAYVSENLHHWIDLIFGFKQTGKAAIEALNVFHPATYYGVIDLNSQPTSSPSTPVGSTVATISAKSSTYSSDYISTADTNTGFNISDTSSTKKTSKRHHKRQNANIERLALETMIKTYGQMPRQLFAQPLRQRSFNTFNLQTNVVQNQMNDEFSSSKREPLIQVKGLRWGSYVGSPDENDITAVKHKRIPSTDPVSPRSRKNVRDTVSRQTPGKFNLCLLPNGEIAVLRSFTSLILDYRADRKSGNSYQFSLSPARYSRRAGLSSIARMNLFSNMIISRQQFNYVEPASFSSSQFDSAGSSTSTLASLTPSRAKFSPDSLSLVSWAYLDGTIRMRHPALNSNKPNVPLVQADSIVDSMSTCTSVPELNLLLVGYKSGSICAHIISTSHETTPIAQYIQPNASAVALSSSSAAPSAVHFLHTTTNSISQPDMAPLGPGKVAGNSPSGEPYTAVSLAGKTLQSVRSINKTSRWLYCHSKSINCMRINVSFGIVVTGSDDGTSVIWDLNSLTYVRTIDYKIKSLRSKSLSEKNGQRFKFDLDNNSNCTWHMYINSTRLLDYLCNCDQHPSSPMSEFSDSEDHDPLSLKGARQCSICASGVNLLSISDTLGDIVSVKDINNRLALAADGDEAENSSSRSDVSTVSSSSDSDSNLSSVIYVHTINGSLVGFVNCHTRVTAVCYSNSPEGLSVNVIVVGLADGLIRLYSSWDLSRVKEFHVSGLDSPISSLLYSRNNQLLYVAYEDGQLVVLRNKKKSSITLPKEWFL